MLSEKMNTALAFVRDAKGVRTQKEFALAVGMPADRLRNIVNDKIKKLQADEAVAIERAFGIRSAWWFSDAAPMLLTEAETAMQPALNEVRNATAEVLALGLDGWRASFVQELLFNVRTKNGPALRDQLDSVLSANSATSHGGEDCSELAGLLSRCSEADREALAVLIRSLSGTGAPAALAPDDRYPKAEDGQTRTVHSPRRKKL